MIERSQPPLGPGVADRFAFAAASPTRRWRRRRRSQERLRGALPRRCSARTPCSSCRPCRTSRPSSRSREEALERLSQPGAQPALPRRASSGLPQVSMPLAARLGAPLGLSLIGPAGSDLSLVRLAARLAGDEPDDRPVPPDRALAAAPIASPGGAPMTHPARPSRRRRASPWRAAASSARARSGTTAPARCSSSTSRTRRSGATGRRRARSIAHRGAGAGRVRGADPRPGHRDRRLQVGPRPRSISSAARSSPSSRPSRSGPATASTTAMSGPDGTPLFRHHGRRGGRADRLLLALGRRGARRLPTAASSSRTARPSSPDGRTLYATDTLGRHRLRPRPRRRQPGRAAALRPLRGGLGPSRTAWRWMRRGISGSATGAARGSPASRRTGRWSAILPVPTAQVTKCAFGGPDLTTLYITTAAIGRDPHIDPMAGHVFAVEAGVTGLPANIFAGVSDR